jgi:ribosomal subunit interface protein
MNRRIAFRNMEKTNHMEEYCIGQLDKIEKFLENERPPVSIDLVLEPSKVHAHHQVELRVNTPHYHKKVQFEGPDFYLVLNRAFDTMYKELHEEKKKQKEHQRELNRHDEVKKAR